VVSFECLARGHRLLRQRNIWVGQGDTDWKFEAEIDSDGLEIIRWKPAEPTAADYADAGHVIINANGDYLYFILARTDSARAPPEPPRHLRAVDPRARSWVQPDAPRTSASPRARMRGAHLSVWCDSPDAMPQEEVSSLLHEWLQVFAQRTWGSPKIAVTLDQLRSAVLPGVWHLAPRDPPPPPGPGAVTGRSNT